MADNDYFKGQGRLYLAGLDSSDLVDSGFRWIGNVPDLRFQTTTNRTEHRESFTGKQGKDLVIDQATDGKVMFTLEDFSKENLALAFFGTSSSISGATVTDESIVVRLGSSVPLANVNLSAFTGLEVGGQTISATGNYTVDLKAGMLTFPASPTDNTVTEAVAGLADYTFAAHTKTTGFSASRKHYQLRFAGVNTVKNNSPVIVDIFKVTFDPQKELALINNTDLSKLEMEGDLLLSSVSTDGGFFRIRKTA
jgi:hypothetical protein